MKKHIIIILLYLLYAEYAIAQSTALPVIFGHLTSSGCPGSQKTCFVPYTSGNPLPIIFTGSR